MGNRFSRRRETLANSSDAVGNEKRAVEEPAADQQAEVLLVSQKRVADEAVQPAAAAEEPVTAASEPVDESAQPEPEASAVLAPPTTEQEPVAIEQPAPAQLEPEPEPPVLVCDPPEPQPISAPEPAVEPTPEPEPIVASESASEPEVVTAPEPTPDPTPDPEPVAVPEPSPVEDLTQESVPEPVISSAALVDVGVPDLSLQSDTPSSEGHVPEESTEALGDGIEAVDPNESVKPECDGPGDVNQVVCDVNQEVSGLLKKLNLGSELVNDLSPGDVNTSEEIPSAE